MENEIHQELEDAIKELKEEISEKEQYISLIKNLNISDTLNEDNWHEICETPLRYSNTVLSSFIKNMFPEAENIKVGCNYACFELYGFSCQIPTSRGRGINVNLDWYKQVRPPKDYTPKYLIKEQEYFELLNSKTDWKELAELKYEIEKEKKGHGRTDSLNPFILFFWWHFYGKRDKINQHNSHELYMNYKVQYANRVTKYEIEKEKMHEKCILLNEKLLPEINKFSTKHFKYNGGLFLDGEISIDKILKLEGIDKNEK